jgi:hypothetical protein
MRPDDRAEDEQGEQYVDDDHGEHFVSFRGCAGSFRHRSKLEL